MRFAGNGEATRQKKGQYSPSKFVRFFVSLARAVAVRGMNKMNTREHSVPGERP